MVPVPDILNILGIKFGSRDMVSLCQSFHEMIQVSDTIQQDENLIINNLR